MKLYIPCLLKNIQMNLTKKQTFSLGLQRDKKGTGDGKVHTQSFSKINALFRREGEIRRKVKQSEW